MEINTATEAKNVEVLPEERIERKIFIVRGQKVILDGDLAELYEVSTKRLNEQVKRNLKRFPTDFMFQLNHEEVESLNRSQFATGSGKHRDPRFLPYAFTEHGITMLSSVLNSDRAIMMSVFIVRTFIKMRLFLLANKDIAEKIERLEHNQKVNAKNISVVATALDRFLSSPPKPERKIGFNVK